MKDFFACELREFFPSLLANIFFAMHEQMIPEELCDVWILLLVTREELDDLIALLAMASSDVTNPPFERPLLLLCWVVSLGRLNVV
jgi:hypothetical protein